MISRSRTNALKEDAFCFPIFIICYVVLVLCISLRYYIYKVLLKKIQKDKVLNLCLTEALIFFGGPPI